MRLVPLRPVTIESVRYGERWFPYIFRHTDGSLLLYVEYGHDGHWSPFFRVRSVDAGKTWGSPTDNVPRACWCHSFADGELFEVDTYGVHDPSTEAVSALFGAWSRPDRPDQPVRNALVRVHAPSLKKVPLLSLQGPGSYPNFHWWPLWNGLHGTDRITGEEIFLLGPYFTSGVETDDGRLIALGYWEHRDPSIEKSCTFCFESSDRGHNWEEISLAATDDSTPEGPDEATLVRLDDGRLYAVIRTGGPLVHTWSEDLGRSWSPLEEVRLVDSDHEVATVWPVVKKLGDGTLVLVYGRPGKHMVFDPSGTGTQWQGHLDLHAWELDTQARMGVPEELRLRGEPTPEH